MEQLSMGQFVAVILGLIMAGVGAALVYTQLRGRPATPPQAPSAGTGAGAPRPWNRALQQLQTRFANLRRPPAPASPPPDGAAPPIPPEFYAPPATPPLSRPLSTEEERRRRLEELRAQRGRDQETIAPIGVTHGTPQDDEFGVAASPAATELPIPGTEAPPPDILSPSVSPEVVMDEERLPATAPWRGGRAPRQTAAWRGAVAQRTGSSTGSTIRALIGGAITLGLVLVIIGLLLRGTDQARSAEPGSAVLAVADFGEGANFGATALGRTTADTVAGAVRDALGAGAETRMPVVRTGLIKSAAEAERTLNSRPAQAVLWGTLPAGATGNISATLAWRNTVPADPWLRYGPTGRLLVPPEVALPNQPLIANAALAPVLAAVQLYHAGDYDGASARAKSVPQDGPADTVSLSGFIRANAAIALRQPAEAMALYQTLEARTWTNAALYNNWGVAALMEGQFTQATDRLNRAAALVAPTDKAAQAIIDINKGIAAEGAGDFAGARTAYDAALAADPGNSEANWRRGYLAYRTGDSTAAETYTNKALSLDRNNPEIERQAGLIDLMQRQPDSAVAHFTRARDTYERWISTLKADEGAATSRNDLPLATRITEQIQALNGEAGTTQYYIGLAYADKARSKPPVGFFESAWIHLTGGKTDAEQAIAAFQDAIRLDRDREDVRVQMGILYRQQGDRQRARDSFAQAKTLKPSAPGAYEQLAEMDLEDKKPDQAVAEYQALIAANPGYLPAYLELADVYHQMGDIAGEQQAYSQVAQQPANTPRDHLIRARALVGLNRPDAAVPEAKAALDGDPSLWEAHLLLAEIYEQAQQNDAALAEYDTVLKSQPNNVEALYESGRMLAARGDTDNARKLWLRVEQIEPAHPEVHFALGGLYEQQATIAQQAGKTNEARTLTDQAIAEYKAAIDKNAGRADAYYHLGRLYEARGDWKQAEQQYQDAVQHDPNIVEAWQGLVRVLEKQPGRSADAVKQAQAFQQHAPGDERAYLLLGDAFLDASDPSAALTQYNQALKIQPGDPQALYGVGRSYALQGDSGRAQQYYSAVLQADPNNVAALTGEGDLYLDQGNNGQAQDAYNHALQIDPNYAPALVGLGRALDKINQGEEARKKFIRASEIDPTAADPHFYLGETYAERAYWDDAIREYTQAAKLRPSWAMPQFRLGQIYLSQRKLPEALNAYQQATRLDPHMLEAWFGLGQAERDSGNRKEAIAAYREAIKLKNDYAAAWLYLGYTLEEDGQRNEAVDAYRHALDSATDDATVRSAAQDALRRLQ
jgi:tetratricopeptide (TPR) repeat protein